MAANDSDALDKVVRTTPTTEPVGITDFRSSHYAGQSVVKSTSHQFEPELEHLNQQLADAEAKGSPAIARQALENVSPDLALSYGRGKDLAQQADTSHLSAQDELDVRNYKMLHQFANSVADGNSAATILEGLDKRTAQMMETQTKSSESINQSVATAIPLEAKREHDSEFVESHKSLTSSVSEHMSVVNNQNNLGSEKISQGSHALPYGIGHNELLQGDSSDSKHPLITEGQQVNYDNQSTISPFKQSTIQQFGNLNHSTSQPVNLSDKQPKQDGILNAPYTIPIAKQSELSFGHQLGVEKFIASPTAASEKIINLPTTKATNSTDKTSLQQLHIQKNTLVPQTSEIHLLSSQFSKNITASNEIHSTSLIPNPTPRNAIDHPNINEKAVLLNPTITAPAQSILRSNTPASKEQPVETSLKSIIKPSVSYTAEAHTLTVNAQSPSGMYLKQLATRMLTDNKTSTNTTSSKSQSVDIHATRTNINVPLTAANTKTAFSTFHASESTRSTTSGDIINAGKNNTADSHHTDKRYITGVEIALATAITAAGAARVRTDTNNPSIDSKTNKNNNQDTELEIHQAIGEGKTPVVKETITSNFVDNKAIDDSPNSLSKDHHEVLGENDYQHNNEDNPIADSHQRPTMLISLNDTLVSIATERYQDPNVSWVIADLNYNRAKEQKIDNKRILEFVNRQEIVLPLWDDIREFYAARSNNKKLEDLITIVTDTQLNAELLDLTLGPLLKKKKLDLGNLDSNKE